MLSGNTGGYFVNLSARHHLGIIDRFANRAHCFFHIDNNTTPEPNGRSFTVTDNIDTALFVGFADKCNYFSRANIKCRN